MTTNISSQQKKKILIIGSGLSAYGACLALIKHKSLEIDVIDIGLKKPYLNQPNKSVPNAKDINGSYFLYGLNDNRWDVKTNSKRICSSHAFGGFSKAYSGSILQPKNNDLINWPKDAIPKLREYADVISTLKIKQNLDELNEGFPIDPLKYSKQISKNCYIGNSRIAIKTENHENQLIPFDSEQKFSEWVNQGLIKYTEGSFVNIIKTHKNKLLVEIQKGDSISEKIYDNIFVGAGCVNTTALIDKSIYGNGVRKYKIKSAPRIFQAHIKFELKNFFKKNNTNNNSYSLCKYFLEYRSKSTKNLWSHTQIGDLNKIILKKIKDKFPFIIYYPLSYFLKLVNFSNSVFHSDLGPEAVLISKVKQQSGKLKQEINIIEEDFNCPNSLIISTTIAIISKFKILRLFPIPFSKLIGNFLSGNKLGGWHYGGTLPMMKSPKSSFNCYTNGEILGLKNVFIIDPSSFPSIPGSTIALLTMTNAYRIASRFKDKYNIK